MASAHGEFLLAQGAHFTEEGSLQHFGTPFDNVMAYSQHLKVLSLTGEDALNFLHGQLTCDMHFVAQGNALFAAHLNLQGRVLFSLWVLPSPDAEEGTGFRLIVPAAMVEQVQEHWKKYLMFSRSTLHVEDTLAVLQVPTTHGAAVAKVFNIAHDELSHNDTWQHFTALKQHYFIAPQAALEDQWKALQTVGAIGGVMQAHYWDVMAGLAQVYPGAEQRFLPQALNYDLFQAVSFNKGCYTGQEVVARMKFKGQLKQRLMHLCWEDAVIPSPGDALRNEQGRALGHVVTHITYKGKQHALAVIRRDQPLPDHVEDRPITATLEPLPYALPEEGK